MGRNSQARANAAQVEESQQEQAEVVSADDVVEIVAEESQQEQVLVDGGDAPENMTDPTPVIAPDQDFSSATISAIKVKARVLVDCAYGKPNDVVEIDASQVESLAGELDAHPEAVAYAESLAAE